MTEDVCELGCGIVHSMPCQRMLPEGGKCVRAFHHSGDCRASSPPPPSPRTTTDSTCAEQLYRVGEARDIKRDSLGHFEWDSGAEVPTPSSPETRERCPICSAPVIRTKGYDNGLSGAAKIASADTLTYAPLSSPVPAPQTCDRCGTPTRNQPRATFILCSKCIPRIPVSEAWLKRKLAIADDSECGAGGDDLDAIPAPVPAPEDVGKMLDRVIRSAEKLTRLMNNSGADDVYRREEENYKAARSEILALVSRLRSLVERMEAEGTDWRETATHLKGALEQVNTDRERIDWLESQHSFSGKWYDEADGFNSPTMQFSVYPESFDADSIRDAIDKARGRRLSSDSETGDTK